MFSYPTTELFAKDGARRVVWSEEEFEQALADGWSEEKPAEDSAEAAGDIPLEASKKPKAKK